MLASIVLQVGAMELDVSRVQKHWTYDIHQFSDNMTVIGVLNINGAEMRRTEIEIGAFCGDQCRGSELLTYYSAVDKYMVFLMVYGQNNNAITFRLYDHKTGVELDATTTGLTFEVNAIHGLPANPYQFEFQTEETVAVAAEADPAEGGVLTGAAPYVYGATCQLEAVAGSQYAFVNWTVDGEVVSTQSTYSFVVMEPVSLVAHFEAGQTAVLTEGWNWWTTAIPVALEDLEAALGDHALAIVSQDGGEAYYENGQWSGTIDAIVPGAMYRIQTVEPCTLSVSGLPVASIVVDIVEGPNWFGYSGERPLDVDDLNITPAEGDKVVSQDEGFAIFEDGVWYGTLESLRPGKGYMYISNTIEAKTLVF